MYVSVNQTVYHSIDNLIVGMDQHTKQGNYSFLINRIIQYTGQPNNELFQDF